jgi:5-methylcytosine-specific restriction endonuclease McrA
MMPHLPRSNSKKKKRKRNKWDKTKAKNYGNKWAKFSRMYRVENPLCEVCKRYNKLIDVTPGDRKGSVDHIIALTNGGAKYDTKNLMSVCNYHQSLKSNLEMRSMFDAIDYELTEWSEKTPTDKAIEDVILLLVENSKKNE